MTDTVPTSTEPSSPTISISEEMRKSYLDYAMSVIVSRALPDVRDGLKPVHRRILYAMMEGNYDWSKPPRKSARIVGDVMGNYHPHGDSSIYEAMVRMAQHFSMRLPLVDGQGNFGSVDGDPPAAMRYTESRLARAAESLLRDIDKETVEFGANYDETQLEPLVLPAEYPNLLVNGANGIAVGMATNIPPHSPAEVIAACEAYIRNPAIEIEELLEIVPGPDFPTGALIMGRAGIRDAYTTGRGSVIMRARAEVVTDGRDRETILVHEIPYQVNKAQLLEISDGIQKSETPRTAPRSCSCQSPHQNAGRIAIPASRVSARNGTVWSFSTRIWAGWQSNICARDPASIWKASCRPANGPTSRALKNTPPRLCCSVIAVS